MTEQEAIEAIKNECKKTMLLLTCNSDFPVALSKALTALEENNALKNRCRVFSNGLLCVHCKMDCENRTEAYNHKRDFRK